MESFFKKILSQRLQNMKTGIASLRQLKSPVWGCVSVFTNPGFAPHNQEMSLESNTSKNCALLLLGISSTFKWMWMHTELSSALATNINTSFGFNEQLETPKIKKRP